MVKRISSGDPTLISKFKLTAMGWMPVASIVFDTFEPGTDKQQRTIQGFAKLWGGLAGELLTEAVIDEYNATKHGFRTRPGGFKIEFAPVKTPDVPPTDAEMTVLGESQFGAMFYKVERLEGKGGRHLRSRRVATNWSLQRDILLLQLAQISINNAVSRLKIANGFPPSACKFLWPANDEDFTRPWSHSPGVTSMSFDFGLNEAAIPEVTKADLLRKLREATGAGA